MLLMCLIACLVVEYVLHRKALNWKGISFLLVIKIYSNLHLLCAHNKCINKANYDQVQTYF